MTEILKVLVGSQAHGLADENSDFDYRGVFVVPTKELFMVGAKQQNTQWIEGKIDDTSWELGHFIQMATRCNPTIMECFHAPIAMTFESANFPVEEKARILRHAQMLRDLFPKLWNSRDLVNSHMGYAKNQRNKFMDDKDGRALKFASAWLRTVYQAYSLFTHGTYPVSFVETEVYKILKDIRAHNIERGEIVSICEGWEKKLASAYGKADTKVTDIDAVNNYLLEVRTEFLLNP